MIAAINKKYGPPEVVSLAEVQTPVPNDGEVLIRIHYSTVNRTDAGFRSAEYFISRFWSGLFKPNNPILGCEFSGTIEQIGPEVTRFEVGDLVFGLDTIGFGCHAEFKILSEDEFISRIPKNLSLKDSTAICEGGHYALNIIRAAKVTEGQNVLLNGATGAIGSAALQLLKSIGAKVTAVCNTKNVDLIKSLGADKVINFEEEDFTTFDAKYDFVFDAVGKSSFKKCKPLLTENGTYISTELGKNGENVFYALISPKKNGKKVLFPIPEINNEQLEYLKKEVERGVFKPIIDKSYEFNKVVEAHKYVETGQKTGNVILEIYAESIS